ncbi:MAG: ABA4-like family protein [Micropepsaceae bacterium]
MSQFSPDALYSALNYGVLPFWALLIFLPHLKITDWLVHSVFAPIILGLVYAWLIAGVTVGGIALPEGAGFASLEGVMKAFTVKEAVLAGWAHYIVFDLFIGAWVARDAQRLGLNHFVVIPCLLLTLLVGPIGLLVYLMVRGLTGRGGTSLFEG